jgi:hypothetical protein
MVTLAGMMMEVRLVQPENAYAVTLSGIVTLVRLVQRENALSSILVTLSGM